MAPTIKAELLECGKVSASLDAEVCCSHMDQLTCFVIMLVLLICRTNSTHIIIVCVHHSQHLGTRVLKFLTFNKF